MKKIIVLLTLLSSLNAFAGTRTVFDSIKVSGATEAEVVANAEALIPSILDASNREVRMDMMSERCWLRSRNMILGSLSIIKSYVSTDNATFNVTYRGSLRYGVKNCRESNK